MFVDLPVAQFRLADVEWMSPALIKVPASGKMQNPNTARCNTLDV
jgi:hypothetical protein